MFEAFSRSGASLIRKSSIVAVVSFCVSSAASATVSVVDHPVGLADPLVLADGDAVVLHERAMRVNAALPIPGWAEDFSSWSANGTHGVKSCTDGINTHTFDTRYAHVEDGDLVLTNDPDQKHNLLSVWRLAKTDALDASWTLSLELPEDSFFATTEGWSQSMAEGFAVGLQAGSPNVAPTFAADNYMSPSFCGFYFSTYGYAYERTLYRVVNGVLQEKWREEVPGWLKQQDPTARSFGGITLVRPVQMRLTVAGGQMVLTLAQDDKTFSVTNETGSAFGADGRSARLAFGAHTGWWYNQSAPWMRTRLSGFSGTVDSAASAVPGAESSVTFSTGEWSKSGDAAISADGKSVEIFKAAVNSKGGILSRRVLPSGKALKVEFDVLLGETISSSIGDGFSVFFLPESAGLTLPTGASEAIPASADARGAYFYYYASEKHFAFFENKAMIADTKVSAIAYGKDRKLHVILEHDGRGLLTVRVNDGYRDMAQNVRMDALVAEPGMRLGFFGNAANWACALQTTISDLKIEAEVVSYRHDVVRGEISVADGANAVLKVDAVPGTGVPTVDATCAFGAGKWTKKGNAVLNGESFNLTQAAGWLKSAAVCSEVLKGGAPFEIDFDVDFGANKSGGAEGFSLVFRPASYNGDIGALASGQHYPKGLKDSVAFAAYSYTRSGTQGFNFIVDGADDAKRYLPAGFSFAEGKTAHVKLSYDGAGGLCAAITQDGKTGVTCTRVPAMTDWGDMRMAFFGATASWECYRVITLRDFAFAPVRMGDYATDGRTLGSFEHLSLGVGSGLTVGPRTAATALGLGCVAFSGAACLTAEAGAVGVLDGIRISDAGAVLTLAGDGAFAFANPFAVIVPRDWDVAPGSTLLVDFSSAHAVGGFPQTVVLRDEDGAEVAGGRIVFRNGRIRFVNGGFMLLLR